MHRAQIMQRGKPHIQTEPQQLIGPILSLLLPIETSANFQDKHYATRHTLYNIKDYSFRLHRIIMKWSQVIAAKAL